MRRNKLRNPGNVAVMLIRGLYDTNNQPFPEGGINMGYEKDNAGNIYTKSDPRAGMPPAGTDVTVYTPNGPVPGKIQGGIAVPINTDKNQ